MYIYIYVCVFLHLLILHQALGGLGRPERTLNDQIDW